MFTLVRTSLLFLCVFALAAGESRADPRLAGGADPLRAGVEAGDPVRFAQLFGQRDDSELIARIGRLENQIRQLTGMIEELQHRNNQLEQQLNRVQEDTEFRFQELGSTGRQPGSRGQAGAPRPGSPAVATRPGGAGVIAPDLPRGTATPGGRGDAFDPTARPDAPGAPRPLGGLPGGSAGTGQVIMAPDRDDAPPPPPGAPLDLGSLAGSRGVDKGGPAGPQAVLAPSGSAKDEYDLAYGAILRRDYELADQGFRRFLANHSGDPLTPEAQRLVPEAHFWLGESQFQRNLHNDAAENFLDVYNKYPNSVRAPEALLRLGQSLAALGKQDYACASLGAVLSKYPRASDSVKRAVEQEQKRARC